MPRFRPETIAAASPRVYAGMRSRGCERRALRLLDRAPRTRQDVQGRRFFAALFSLIDDLSTKVNTVYGGGAYRSAVWQAIKHGSGTCRSAAWGAANACLR